MPDRLEQHTQVREDLLDIHTYIAQDDPDAADRVVDSIRQTFQRLLLQPRSGSAYSHPDVMGLRKVIVPKYHNYLIFYRETPDSVRILYVIHAARDLPTVIHEQPRQ